MPTKFLVDENLSPSLAEFLRSLKYDAWAVREVGLIGQTDTQVSNWANQNNAVIITRDLGFGTVFSLTKDSPGIILLRSKSDSIVSFQTILDRLHQETVLANPELTRRLVVATPVKTRIINAHNP